MFCFVAFFNHLHYDSHGGCAPLEWALTVSWLLSRNGLLSVHDEVQTLQKSRFEKGKKYVIKIGEGIKLLFISLGGSTHPGFFKTPPPGGRVLFFRQINPLGGLDKAFFRLWGELAGLDQKVPAWGQKEEEEEAWGIGLLHPPKCPFPIALGSKSKKKNF